MASRQAHNNVIAIFVPYSAVFSDCLPTFDNFTQVVKTLSRTDALFWCARLSLLLADPNLDDRAKQENILHMFFTPEQVGTLNEFVRVHGGADRIKVLHRGTLLELIRWVSLLCTEHPDDGKTFDKPEVREVFVKALLMANDFWGQRIYTDSAFNGASIDEQRMNTLISIRRSIQETRNDLFPLQTLARGVELFQRFFPELYPGFAKAFAQYTGLSLDEYYICLCTLMSHYMNSESKSGVGSNDDAGIFTVENVRVSTPHMEPFFSKFFDLESGTPDQLATVFWPKGEEGSVRFTAEYRMRPLLNRPILRASDGRMIILDPVCFAEKARVGPLFHLLAAQKDLQSKFGYVFEAYAGSVLQRIYPDTGPHLAKRLHSDVREARDRGIQVADFIIEDVTDLILIEAKAVWVKEEVVSKDNPDSFIEHLCAKYGHDEKEEKGYGQLARTINKLSTKEWEPLGIHLSQVKHIFPILLVHDTALDAPVFGYFLAQEFRLKLRPDSIEAGLWMVKGSLRVAPLIVMTIDDLENLESSLEGFYIT